MAIGISYKSSIFCVYYLLFKYAFVRDDLDLDS